jgi:hypothetical protein
MIIQIWSDDGDELLDDIKIDDTIKFDNSNFWDIIRKQSVVDFLTELFNMIEGIRKAGYK